jgi:hypothetical protein
MNACTPRMRYTDTQLAFAYLRDLIVDIRCARRDHTDANPLLAYADKCAAEFRRLWPVRHGAHIGRYGVPVAP